MKVNRKQYCFLETGCSINFSEKHPKGGDKYEDKDVDTKRRSKVEELSVGRGYQWSDVQTKLREEAKEIARKHSNKYWMVIIEVVPKDWEFEHQGTMILTNIPGQRIVLEISVPSNIIPLFAKITDN